MCSSDLALGPERDDGVDGAVLEHAVAGARVGGDDEALPHGLGVGVVLDLEVQPGVVEHAPTLLALYYLGFALGGPGFSVPMGLFLAGVSVTSGFMRLLPRWLVIFGVVLAFAGELSLFHLAFPKLIFLIPLTRFPGFIWVIATGFLLAKKQVERGDPV